MEGDIYFSRNELVMPLVEISSCITGKQKEVDEHGNIIVAGSCEKDFSRAHALFSDVENRLRAYPKITKYQIAQSILREMSKILNELKQDIENLTNGSEKSLFGKEFNQLAQYVSSLMDKKDV